MKEMKGVPESVEEQKSKFEYNYKLHKGISIKMPKTGKKVKLRVIIRDYVNKLVQHKTGPRGLNHKILVEAYNIGGLEQVDFTYDEMLKHKYELNDKEMARVQKVGVSVDRLSPDEKAS